jgi:polyhydroxyalkanoate synthesis regulator phasin
MLYLFYGFTCIKLKLKSRKEDIMIDLLKKNMMMGLGLATMTKRKITELGEKLAEEGRLSQEEGEKLVKELLKAGEENKKNMEDKFFEIISNTMKKVDPPCTEKLASIEKKIDSLNRKLSKIEKKLGDG